jgi:hypothetical protein
MNHHVAQDVRGPLARIGRRVAAIVAECNYAQTRMTSLRDTPARFCPRGISSRQPAGLTPGRLAWFPRVTGTVKVPRPSSARRIQPCWVTGISPGCQQGGSRT